MRLLIVFSILLLAVPSPADVPGEPPEFSDLELDLICGITAPTSVLISMTIGVNFDGGVQGLALERSELGNCASAVRINEIQYGTLAAGAHTVMWTDASAVFGIAYRYRVIGLKSNGDEVSLWPSFDMASPVDYATCGDPVVGHGLITSDIAPGLLEPCDGGCWDFFTVEVGDPILDPFVESGIPVQLIGSIDCTLGNVEGCHLNVTEVIAVPCPVVATQKDSWGAVKARF